jgi:ribonuclease P protein component
MLPASARLRRPAEFQSTTRAGRKTGRASLVLHLRPTGQPARVGFVVPKAVGPAVVRNRVKRRLRHLVAPRLGQLAADVVIRALPAAARRPDRLAADLESAWRWAVARPGAAPDGPGSAGPSGGPSADGSSGGQGLERSSGGPGFAGPFGLSGSAGPSVGPGGDGAGRP